MKAGAQDDGCLGHAERLVCLEEDSPPVLDTGKVSQTAASVMQDLLLASLWISAGFCMAEAHPSESAQGASRRQQPSPVPRPEAGAMPGQPSSGLDIYMKNDAPQGVQAMTIHPHQPWGQSNIGRNRISNSTQTQGWLLHLGPGQVEVFGDEGIRPPQREAGNAKASWSLATACTVTKQCKY